MLGLLTAMGGAAAIELGKMRRGNRRADDQITKLREREEQLSHLVEAMSAELHSAKDASRASSSRAEELCAAIEAIKEEKAKLERETALLSTEGEELKQKNALLSLQTLRLAQEGGKLAREKEELDRANRLLALECETLRQQQHDEHSLLEGMKEQLAEVITRFFNNDIDAAQLIREVRDMGCAIDLSEEDMAIRAAADASGAATEPAMEFGAKFVLDSPGKMRHLIQAALQAQQQQPLALPAAAPALATLRLPDPDRKVTAEHPRAFGLTWLTGSASAQAPGSSTPALAAPQGAATRKEPARAQITPRDAPAAAADTSKATRGDVAVAARNLTLSGNYLTTSSPKKAPRDTSKGLTMLNLGGDGAGSGRAGRSMGATVYSPEDDSSFAVGANNTLTRR